ncbi:MAG: radical SAM protein [Desulfobacteraceae bacterium]|jgi:wyosine [tRNA(Phe)-imidazoG37] synthetase (radical SAM superfamily)
MSYIFGPVPSRRLGLSLGVDLIPRKTCSYDCIYCQVGKTTDRIMEPSSFVSVSDVIEELKEVLLKTPPDVITLAGSGEPTLNTDIGLIISEIKKITSIPVTLLTNGSLLWNRQVREKITDVDILIPTLSSVYEETYKKIHRPHPGLKPDDILKGLKETRKECAGDFFLEVVLLKGLNDTEKEISGLLKAINDIQPDKVQLNTVVRPPSDPGAISLSNEKLEEIKKLLGGNTEIIAAAPLKSRAGKPDSIGDQIIEMIKRRPVTVDDISNSLNIQKVETERFIKGLIIKGHIQEQKHGDNLFYTSK